MAAALFRSVSEVGMAQDPSSPNSNHDRESGSSSRQISARPKRLQVSAACEHCRQRRIKCDGLRPCAQCAKKNITCQHRTENGETHSQAQKRKFEAISQSHETFAELFYMLERRSEQDAAEIVRRIRSGYRPDAVLRFMKTGDIASFMPDPRRAALEAFLISLAHSTGSTRDIAKLAFLTLEASTKDDLPTLLNDLRKLQNRIVRVPYVENLLKRSERPSGSSLTLSSVPTVTPSLNDVECDDSTPPYEVPAAPWTSITTNSEAVSHLVSLFFAWINPTWRFVERDLFLRGMRSERLDSILCSPFLVNSICAIASVRITTHWNDATSMLTEQQLHSEHEVAFAPNDPQRIARGQHFHDEALRLWLLEENRPTLTNIQALCILALESNYRAKDRFGLTLTPIAVQLNSEIPLLAGEKRCATQGISIEEFARLRLSIHWSAKCTHLIMRIAFMSGAESKPDLPGLAKIHEVFEDKAEPWFGYPLTRDTVAHRPTLYLRERCRLAGLFQEMHNLIFASDTQRSADLTNYVHAVDDLSTRMQQWYENLPFELQYQWPMSVAVWELHASYLAFMMILCLSARTRVQQERIVPHQHSSNGSDHDDTSFRRGVAQHKLSYAISLAHRAARILRDFRERYGLKVSPAWLLQLQAVTAGVLLLDPALAEPKTLVPAAGETRDETISDSHSAFDEVFRGLLGTGVQVMVARAIARMMYHSALEQKIALSRSTRDILQVMSDTSWRPSDLSLVNSVFPNFATTTGHEDRERMTELLSKWERLEI